MKRKKSCLPPILVGLFLGSQLCGQKPNILKPARSLFIRGEGGFLQVRGIFIRCVVSPHWWCLIGGTVLPSHHQSGGLFPIRVVSELSGLKGVLLARIMEKMHLPVFAAQKPEFMSDEEWDFEHQQ
ncbi:hypothetical protein CR513_61288, partial [Mucuna pruriens]